ncbi:LytR C-terminal domain-containing protein [Cellulosimicrobium terreum]|nr:LytR C-terminal domain-containing protein [Cellulosimicrobium terreum]
MTKSRYPYAPDEFDAPAPQGAPVGVHRTPRGGWSKTWPFLLVAVIFAGVAYGGFALFLDGSSEAPPQAQSTEPSVEEPAAPTDEATEEPAETDEPTGEESEPTDEESEETEDATDIAALLEVADTGAYVRVLNASGIGGEAGKGRDALTGEGFTQVEAADYDGSPDDVSGTTVWYAADRSDTAAAVAAILGVPAENVSQQPLRTGDVVVIVKSELTPAG